MARRNCFAQITSRRIHSRSWGSRRFWDGLSRAPNGAPATTPVVVLGYGFWQAQFGGDAGVLGRELRLNGVLRTVVGVMPRRFVWRAAEIYVPVVFKRGKGEEEVRLFGRLKPGVTRAHAESDLRSIIAELEKKDFANGWLRLEPGETKNGDGRMFPLTPWLRAVLERERRRTEALERGMGQIIPWVFHRDGEGIRYFRRRWLTACKAAGFARPIRRKDGRLVWLPTRIPHDFRRTAVRNLERAGVPRSAAMAMVGHKTEAIYRRYAIADEKMLREGAARLAAFIEPARGQRAKASGPVSELRARKLVAWDGVEPPTRGFSVRTSCGTTCLHLSLSPSIQRVTTTLFRAAWSIVSIETNSSAKVQPKSKAACGDPGPDE